MHPQDRNDDGKKKKKPKPTSEIDFFAALVKKSNSAQDGKQSKKKDKKPAALVVDQPVFTSTKLTKYNAYSADAPCKKRKKPTSLKKRILHVSQ